MNHDFSSPTSTMASDDANEVTYVFVVPDMTIEEARLRICRAILKIIGVTCIQINRRMELTVLPKTTINADELCRVVKGVSGHATLVSSSVINKQKYDDQNLPFSPPHGVTSNVDVHIPEENIAKKEEEHDEMLKSFKAIDIVTQEIDKISVFLMEVALSCENKLTNEEFVVVSELLTMQLLKLDTIEAEGEARLQRKAEVQRVQKLHDILDELKTRNLKPNDTNREWTSVTKYSMADI